VHGASEVDLVTLGGIFDMTRLSPQRLGIVQQRPRQKNNRSSEFCRSDPLLEALVAITTYFYLPFPLPPGIIKQPLQFYMRKPCELFIARLFKGGE